MSNDLAIDDLPAVSVIEADARDPARCSGLDDSTVGRFEIEAMVKT